MAASGQTRKSAVALAMFLSEGEPDVNLQKTDIAVRMSLKGDYSGFLRTNDSSETV